MSMEKVTTVMGIEFLEHDMTILDKLPAGIYVKAIIVENDCAPRTELVKIEATRIDHCWVPVETEVEGD